MPNMPSYVQSQMQQIQPTQYRTAQMMPQQQVQSMATMPPRSAEEEEERRMRMKMSGLDPDNIADRMRFMGQNISSLPARAMEMPGNVAQGAKEAGRGLLDLFK